MEAIKNISVALQLITEEISTGLFLEKFQAAQKKFIHYLDQQVEVKNPRILAKWKGGPDNDPDQQWTVTMYRRDNTAITVCIDPVGEGKQTCYPDLPAEAAICVVVEYLDKLHCL